MTIIKVENLTKEFRQFKREPGLVGGLKGLLHREYIVKQAVSNISMDIEEGEIIGYLGPNGAGKSTTIKMLVGITVPSSGKVEVCGYEPHKSRQILSKKIGIVFGQRSQLWWDIPVSDTLNLLRYMYKIPEKNYKENIEMFYELLGIHEFKDIPVRQLSLGQRMRADICCSLLHNPEIILLDEPTIGLDVVVKEKIRSFIKEVNVHKKTTVLITTHDMSDIEKLCSRVVIIDKGAKMFDGNLDYLKKNYGSMQTLTAELSSPLGVNLLYIQEDGVISKDLINNTLKITYDSNIINSSKIISKIMKKVDVVDFKIIEMNTEDIIRDLYQNISTGLRSV
ncbi:ATP-binding cassette domain-containing protein [Paenibacillus glucanolyticus]|uniref:ATP-binding cassette domain-containing protein n=1 Tax=Paenibacillus glucanolyticus TaxID=59843 RepID=UPI0034CD324B